MGFKFFVYYDDEGNITAITNEKRSSGKYLEADELEVADFLNGTKDFSRFKITSLTSGKKEIKLANDKFSLVYKDFYIVDNSTENEQVTIYHNSKNNLWNIKINGNLQLLNFNFYICKKDNFNFLVREINVPAKRSFSTSFLSDIELKKDFTILVKRAYESYGIIYE